MNPELLSALNAHFSQDPVGSAATGTLNLKQMLIERLLNPGGSGNNTEREDLERSWQQAQKQLHILRRNQHELRSLLGYVGETFGACPTCWGTRVNCPECHGHGHPGKFTVNREEFLAWVEPALIQLGLQLTPRQAPVAGQTDFTEEAILNTTERKAP